MQRKAYTYIFTYMHTLLSNPYVQLTLLEIRIVDDACCRYAMQPTSSTSSKSQGPFLRLLLIALHLIARFELCPVLKAHTAFIPFAHLRDVSLHVLE